MTDKDALVQLANLHAVECVSVSDKEHVDGSVPSYAELELVLDYGTFKRLVHLSRGDAELIIEVLHETLHPGANKRNPLQRMWADMDALMAQLMDGDAPAGVRKSARTLAAAIAYVSQPYSPEPDIDSVRSKAVARWESNTGKRS